MTSWFEMRRVGLEFLDEAPMRVEVGVWSVLSRHQLWAAFTDATTWSSWFPDVRSADYPKQSAPYGVGTVRVADVGGMLFEETILAWDEPTRWTYRIDRCTTDLASAQVEATEFAELPDGGTQVRWTLACNPRPLMAGVADAMPAILEGKLAGALRSLERENRARGFVGNIERDG